MWDLSSQTRDQTPTPCITRQILNCWTAREVSQTSQGMVDSWGLHFAILFAKLPSYPIKVGLYCHRRNRFKSTEWLPWALTESKKQKRDSNPALGGGQVHCPLSTTTVSLGRYGERTNTSPSDQVQPRICKLHTKQTSHWVYLYSLFLAGFVELPKVIFFPLVLPWFSMLKRISEL